MADKLKIYNLAISTIGANLMTDVDEDTHTGEIVRLFYPEVKERILRENTWNCAKKRVQIDADDTPPEFGWDNRFEVPTDYIRVLAVNDPPVDFIVQAGYILSNVDVADVYYIADVDETEFDAFLVRCIQYALASELANALVQNVQLSSSLENKLQRFILPRAKHLDSLEQYGQTWYNNEIRVERTTGYEYH